MAEYKIFFKRSVDKDLKSIPKNHLKKILDCISILAENPRSPGCEKPSGLERYRIVYSIQADELTVGLLRSVIAQKWKLGPGMGGSFQAE
jgi:mRNA interferase RelE/StbE